MSETSPSPSQPANGVEPKSGNPWRTATVVVAVVGAGLTAITGLAGFGIGLGVGKAFDGDGGHHAIMASFDGPGRHDGDRRGGRDRHSGHDGRDAHHGPGDPEGMMGEMPEIPMPSPQP